MIWISGFVSLIIGLRSWISGFVSQDFDFEVWVLVPGVLGLGDLGPGVLGT